MAIAQGWYDDRREAQAVSVVVLTAAACGTLISLRLLLGPAWLKCRLTIIGLMMLMAFILPRTATFHHVAATIGMEFDDGPINFPLECGALCVIALGSSRWRRMHRQPTTPEQTSSR